MQYVMGHAFTCISHEAVILKISWYNGPVESHIDFLGKCFLLKFVLLEAGFD